MTPCCVGSRQSGCMATRRKAKGEDEYRRRLLEGLSGSVIEVGAGNGLNFPFYPDAVERVLAVEPEPLLREAASKNAADAPVPVEVVDGVSGRLPAEDETFDAGVASLVLCSVPDQARALSEFRRVICPGGELRFYEHVIARRPPQQAAAPSVAARRSSGPGDPEDVRDRGLPRRARYRR